MGSWGGRFVLCVRFWIVFLKNGKRALFLHVRCLLVLRVTYFVAASIKIGKAVGNGPLLCDMLFYELSVVQLSDVREGHVCLCFWRYVGARCLFWGICNVSIAMCFFSNLHICICLHVGDQRFICLIIGFFYCCVPRTLALVFMADARRHMHIHALHREGKTMQDGSRGMKCVNI